MLQDIRYALRQFRRQPGFAAVAVATLALGVGSVAAVLSLIDGVLLSPLPYAAPERLVLVSPARTDGLPYDRGFTVRQWTAWRESRTLEAPALYQWTFNFLVLPDGSEALGGMQVTLNYFRVLGLTPVVGRVFTEDEARGAQRPPTAIVIGYDLWQRRFGGDPAVVGTAVRLSRMGAPLTVVGVMPPGVRFLPDPHSASEPNYDVNARVDFWYAARLEEAPPDASGWNAVARLRDGATAPAAQAEVAGRLAALSAADTSQQGITAEIAGLRDVLNMDGQRLLGPLFASVLLVFLIACANVAGLLLARGLQRQQEFAMRSALGAGAWRLFRQVMAESGVMAVAGAVAGAALAAAIVAALKALGADAVPRADAVRIGWPVAAFGFAAALVAASIAGLLPAVRASMPGRASRLGAARSTPGRAERRLLGVVATLQVVLTVALLAGAALLVRTAYNLTRTRPGFDTAHVLAMTVTAVERGTFRTFHARALARVSALPGVEHAAFAWGLPLTGNMWPADVEIPGQPGSGRLVDRLTLPLRSVTPDYFAVMGIRVVEGRAFRESDDEKATRVAVVNEAFARRHFGGAGAVGRDIRFGRTLESPVRIVGIIADTRTESLGTPPVPEVYLPFWQTSAFSKHLVVRAAGDPRALAAAVRGELRAIDPTAAVERVTTMDDIRRASLARWTFATSLMAGFAVVATALALVGLYGVLALSVGARTREIGVRQAVGARRSQVVGLVLGEGLRLVAAGAALGLLAAVLLGRLLEALLVDVTPADPLALAAAVAVFGVVASATCLVPANRAGRVDVMQALRHE
jgi:putative ABC transport system permease protein